MTDALPPRSHNREEDSPESLRQSIETLAQAIADLDRRLDDATLGLSGEIANARDTTRRVAVEVGNMGEALVRRIETARESSKLNRINQGPRKILANTAIILLLLIVTTILVLNFNDKSNQSRSRDAQPMAWTRSLPMTTASGRLRSNFAKASSLMFRPPV